VDAVVYLVPLGRDRYELYSEPPDEDEPAAPRGGVFRRWTESLRARWRSAVRDVRHDEPSEPSRSGVMARARHWLVSQIAETIASQRTLWSLRHAASVEMRYPDSLAESAAVERRRQLLADARRHHGIWLIADGALFAASGVFVLVPGPNVLAYYFGLRLVGHYLSWRGARRGLEGSEWHPCAEPALAELGALAHLPRESRAPRVEAIATTLKLPRLAAFFDRVAG
jgi:K+-H+ exchange-related protein